MKSFKTTIAGYTVELETEINSDPSTQCDISKGEFCASLACLLDTGVLSDGDSVHSVRSSVVERISDWADENGY